MNHSRIIDIFTVAISFMENRIKIAIIDDHALFRKGLAMLIESFGYIVHLECNNGNEFIASLNESDLSDIVVMDLKLPIADAVETTRWIKRNYPDIKVLAVTIYDDDDLFLSMLKEGVSGFLPKSASPDEMQKAIQSLIQTGYYLSFLVNEPLRLLTKINLPVDKRVELTHREKQVLTLICQDKTLAEIAQEIFLSRRTVEGMRARLFEKTGVHSTVGLALYAVRNGLLESESLGLDIEKSKVVENASEPNSEIEDQLSSTVYSPKQISPGERFIIQVFAHTSDQALLLNKIARGIDDDTKIRGSAPIHQKIERGTKLTFSLLISSLEIDEPIQTAYWTGDILSIQFEIKVPLGHKIADVVCTVIISVNSIPIGHLKFKLKIIEINSTSYPQKDQKTHIGSLIRYKQAFISYASQDRSEVLKRVQMLNLVKLKFFQDLITLEPGDNWLSLIYEYIDKSDVFFLFWSKAASQSEWVHKEVKYAIKRQAENEDAYPEIIPIIIDGPPPAKAPTELSYLNFNDKFIYFISNH
jgi:DNA-binding NarL/FixJ family response regulator